MPTRVPFVPVLPFVPMCRLSLADTSGSVLAACPDPTGHHVLLVSATPCAHLQRSVASQLSLASDLACPAAPPNALHLSLSIPLTPCHPHHTPPRRSSPRRAAPRHATPLLPTPLLTTAHHATATRPSGDGPVPAPLLGRQRHGRRPHRRSQAPRGPRAAARVRAAGGGGRRRGARSHGAGRGGARPERAGGRGRTRAGWDVAPPLPPVPCPLVITVIV